MTDKDNKKDFADLAQKERRSIFGEFFDFLKHNKKWWLLPLLLLMLLLGMLIFLSGTAIAPFIYPLF